MTEKNIDFVTSEGNTSFNWSYTIGPRATKGEEILEEEISIIKQFFEVFPSFSTPLKMEYDFCEVPKGKRPAEAKRNRSDCVSSEIESFDGIGFKKFEQVVDDERRKGRNFIDELYFSKTRTKVNLREGEEWIDYKSDDKYMYWYRGGIEEGTPSRGPLTFSLFTSTVLSRDESKDGRYDFAYSFVIHSKSDIWFQDNEIGRKNRERLARSLRDFEQGLNVVYRDCSSNGHNLYLKDDVEELFLGG
jgi:hypothetical protein